MTFDFNCEKKCFVKEKMEKKKAVKQRVPEKAKRKRNKGRPCARAMCLCRSLLAWTGARAHALTCFPFYPLFLQNTNSAFEKNHPDIQKGRV